MDGCHNAGENARKRGARLASGRHNAAVIDAADLTELLRGSGALPAGEVASVAVRDSGAFNSATVFAEAVYRDADPALPTRLVIKRPSEAPWSRAAAAVEAGFYRYLATLPDHPPVVPDCLAATDECLVLADLSPTHVAPVTRAQSIALAGVPTMDALDAAVDALAALHAYWWRRDSGPFEVASSCGDASRFDAYAQRRRQSWSRIESEVPEPARSVYQSIVDGLDRFGERLHRRRRTGPLTMVHGDAYLSNFLVPTRGPGLGVLLDWQSPSIDIGALDLANMCATFWTREQRRGYEERVLRRYHVALGQPDYGYGDLLADYRIAVADWSLVPVQDAADGSHRDYWWPKMCCLLDAFDDHGAADLFT
jgi:aminoglycoside phosphotransferase (APT) family kinase protein